MRKYLIRFAMLLGYSIPYVFLAMYGGVVGRTMGLYVPLIVCLTLLCLLAIKTHNVLTLLVGNVCSFISSYMFMIHYQTEKWVWYSKPFSSSGLLIMISIIAFSAQIIMIYFLEMKKSKRNAF